MSLNRAAMLKNDNYFYAEQKKNLTEKQQKREEEIKLKQQRLQKQNEILLKQPLGKKAKHILALRKKQQSRKQQAEIQGELAFINSQQQTSSLLSFVTEPSRKQNNDISVQDIKSLLQSKRKKKTDNPNQKIEASQSQNSNQAQLHVEIEKKDQLELTDSKTCKEITNKKQDDDDYDDLMAALKAASVIQSKYQNNQPPKTQQSSKPFAKVNIFKPKSTLKLIQIPQEKNEKKEKFKSRDELQRERRMEDKKMKAQIQKLEKTYAENKDEQKGKEKADQEGDGQKKEKKTNKKIKKSMNYQALDLKRKYKDKFVGGMRQNQRKYTKNGVLKPQYRLNKELEVQNGEVNNIYAHSLSSAFFLKINIDSQNESEGQEQKPIEIPAVEESTEQRLTQLILKMFGFEKFREGQYQVINNIVNHQSTIFVSQTASGKSLTYIISSIIMAKQFEGMSIVISPLIALMLDQLDHLPLELPAACISSLINYEQRNHILTMIKEKKVKLLFITPEMLMTDILFHVKQFPPINFVCVDQAHCLSELSHNFRTSYIALSQIIKNHVNYNTPTSKPNILCLTATANTETIESLSKKLDIKQIIKSSSTLNKNLYITISRQIRAQNKYRALVQYLNTRQIMKCEAVLIYCRAKYLLDNVWNFLSNSNISASVFHGGLEHKEKTRIITEFKNKKIKIIISTTALGMGLDFEHLDCIVHFNMAKSLESYVQQIGRAGRRQNRAYCHLFLDQSDFLIERNYILADQLEEQSMKVIVEQLQNGQSILKRKAVAKKAQKNKKQKKEDQKEEKERVVKRAVLEIEKMEKEEEHSEDFEYLFEDSQQNAEQQNQNHQENQNFYGFAPLYCLNVKELAQKTNLREQALLIILMKTAESLNKQLTKNSDEQVIRILPLSNEILKLSFFRSNEKELLQSEKHGEFYRKLVEIQDLKTIKSECKKVNGTYHIPLIERCNQMKMSPIQLMSHVYEISNEYTMRVQFLNEVYVFSIDESKRFTRNQVNEKLKDKLFQQSVINMVNEVQNMSMTKLEVFYSLGFDHSQIRVEEIIKKKLLIDRSTPIPPNNIMNEIAKYFNTDINSFYAYLTGSGDELQRQMFLPTQTIEFSEMNNVYQHVKLFFKHMYSNLRDNNNKQDVMKRKEALVDMYKDGKIITRVFLGVNDEKSSRAIYGEHSYWRQFIKKKYFCLLKVVRELIEKYRDDLLSA